MAVKEIEVILTRQLADYLAMPILVVDPAGNLLFYNEGAEKILGRRFEETGEMNADEWAHWFTPTDASGAPLPAESLPLAIALDERHPAHLEFWIEGFDKVRRLIQVTAFPLVGQAQRFLGAMAIFWEVSE